jgi:protocatechuate 3,4-dioxygenase beta subunit
MSSRATRGICTWVGALLLVGFQAGFAQTVRGTVVVDGGRPLSGVVVALVDATQKEVGRALTNEQGEYRLTAPRPGTYRIRTLRIGFQSLLTPAIALAAGDDITRPLTVSTLVFSLDTVRSTGRNACKVVAGDSTSVVAAIWDQVRSALIATQLTLARRTMQSTSISYDRMLDLRSRRIGSQTLDVRTEFATQPWRSYSAAELRKNGYVYTADDSSRIYHSPDLTVLLSDEFIEDHCLRISKDSDDRRLGIEFEPTPARRNYTEIRGTLWLDRKTNELQEMEHRYINRIRLDEERIAGGEMGFSRMRNGGWVISRWNIHMPVLALVPVYSPTMAVLNHEIRLDSIKQTGAELVMAVTAGSRRDTIWMRPPISIRGTVLDSLSGQPVARAIVGLAGTIQVDTTDNAGRFTIGGILPGRYSLSVMTPSLDSLNTVDQRSVLVTDSSMSLTVRVPNATMIAGAVCGKDNTATRLGAGILLGSVVRSDSSPVANASVAAQWNEFILSGGAASNRIRETQTRTDARGVFRICGMPTATSFTVYAKADGAEASPVSVKLAGGQLFGRADLVMDRAASAVAKFTGVVVDSSGKPLPDADVQVTDLALSGSTGSDGKFVIPGVAAGNHSVMVRKLGYGPLEAKLDFAAGDATDRRIMLTRIETLDTMRTTGNALWREAPLLREFEENRKIGLGKFYTRADLAKAEGRSMGSLFEAPGFMSISAGGATWIKSVRTRSVNPHCYELEDAVAPGPPKGSECGCFPIVYLDYQRLSDVRHVANINRYRAMELEAVEFYRSGAETPPRYATLNSECGVIVMHSRRADVKPDTGKSSTKKPPTG